MLKVGVIGVGFLGRHHARVYASLPNVELVGVCDIQESVGQAVASEYGTNFFADYKNLASEVDALSLAVPTVNHCSIACELLSAKKSVLVEKPIAVTLAEADQMVEVAKDNRVILQVGHLERYNPAVAAAFEVIKSPRFFEIHRMGIFTRRSLDIDVVTDLMIHDLEILRFLVPYPVTSIQAVGIPILTPQIDIANARIEFANGCVANVTASRISSEKIRKLRFFQANDYVSVDYTAQQIGIWSLIPPSNQLGSQITERFLELEKDEPLRAQLADFVEVIETGSVPRVDGIVGRDALKLALQVISEIEHHSKRVEAPHF